MSQFLSVTRSSDTQRSKMPSQRHRLSEDQKAIVTAWVEQNGAYPNRTQKEAFAAQFKCAVKTVDYFLTNNRRRRYRLLGLNEGKQLFSIVFSINHCHVNEAMNFVQLYRIIFIGLLLKMKDVSLYLYNWKTYKVYRAADLYLVVILPQESFGIGES